MIILIVSLAKRGIITWTVLCSPLLEHVFSPKGEQQEWEKILLHFVARIQALLLNELLFTFLPILGSEIAYRQQGMKGISGYYSWRSGNRDQLLFLHADIPGL